MIPTDKKKTIVVNPDYANKAYISDSFKETLLADAIKDGNIKSIYNLLMEGVNPNAELREEWTDGLYYLEYKIGCPLDIATSFTVKKLLKYFGANKMVMNKPVKVSRSAYEIKWERNAEKKRRKLLRELIPELYST